MFLTVIKIFDDRRNREYINMLQMCISINKTRDNNEIHAATQMSKDVAMKK
jgi:hypothetical protein